MKDKTVKADWDKCPLCGSARITKKASELSIQTRNGPVQTPRIEYHECRDCGERFFDYEASKTVDECCLERAGAEKK